MQRRNTKVLATPDSAIQCDKVRYYISRVDIPTITNQIDVDVYKDGSWPDVYQGSFTTGSWMEKSFTEGSVTASRFRFGHPVKRLSGLGGLQSSRNCKFREKRDKPLLFLFF